MALFAHRPEEPTDWAGLPSEPDRVRSAAERLSDSVSVDMGLDTAFGGSAAAIESIIIPVIPVVESAQAQETDEGE